MGFINKESIDELICELPFIKEEISNIHDLSDFLCFIEQSGEPTGYDFVKDFKELAFQFEIEKFPDNIHAELILGLKYIFTFNWVSTFNVDATGVWDIPYLDESIVDFKASYFLAKSGYFKQANQVLRSAIECMIVHSCFFLTNVVYDDLKKTNIPIMRDKKKGLIKTLLEEEVLESKDADRLWKIYNSLGDAIHSQWRFMNIKFEESSDIEDCNRWISNFNIVAQQALILLMRTLKSCVFNRKNLKNFA